MPLTIPQYITIKTAAGATAAYLSPEADSLKDVWVNNELNGRCILTFSLPLPGQQQNSQTLTIKGVIPETPTSGSKWQYLNNFYRIYAPDIAGNMREFVILNPDAIEKKRDGKKLWGKVTAHESWVLLGKKYADSGISNDPQTPNPPPLAVIILSGGSDLSGGLYTPGTAGHALYAVLQGTGWSVGTVDVEGTHDLETEKESILKNINRIQETWGGYLIWDSINKTVSLRSEETWVPYTGYQVRYGKNLKGVTRNEDTDITTKLFPFGADDLNISSVNNGKIYIENYSYTTEEFAEIWSNQDIEDPQELLDEATKYLARKCKPRYNYEVKQVDLRLKSGYQHEDYDLGHMVDIIDYDLDNTDDRARIIGYRFNIFQPWNTELEVGDPIEKIDAMLENSQAMVKYLNSIKTRKGQITAYKLVNESLIAEKIAKAAVDATKLNTKVVVLLGDEWQDNIPAPGSVSWNQHKLYYAGQEYIIQAGNSTQKYIYWDGAANAYLTSATEPTLTDGQFIIAVNNGGLHDTVWDKGYAREFIGSAFIAEAAIRSAHIAEAQILDAHIAELSANKITSGLIDAALVQVGVGTVFEPGYDPSTKETPAGAQAKADAAQAAAIGELNNFVANTYNPDIAAIQDQIDGNITTWFYAYVPTTTNVPASGWTTTEDKNNHLGDLFYDTTTGYCYRWALVNSVYQWIRITDSDVTKALADAAAAQDTADSKRRVFLVQPTPPYDPGDLWRIEGQPDLKICVTQKIAGQSYNAADWVLATNAQSYAETKASEAQAAAEAVAVAQAALAQANAEAYADGIVTAEEQARIDQAAANLATAQTYAETKASEAESAAIAAAATYTDQQVAVVNTKAEQAITAAAGAQATADGKVTTFFQGTTPTTTSIGDLWINTADSNKLYRWNGVQWDEVRDAGITEAISAAATAQSTADGKIVTFYQTATPTATSVGDLWVDTDNNNHLHRWNGSAWVSCRDGGIAIAQSTADQAEADAQAALDAAATAQATADGKITTFYQTEMPTTGSLGDLWIDTNDGNKLYRHNGTTFVAVDDTRLAQAITDAAEAQATADSKVTTFFQTTAPTAESIGDLWVDTDNDNQLNRWDGANWVSCRDGKIVDIEGNLAGHLTNESPHNLPSYCKMQADGFKTYDNADNLRVHQGSYESLGPQTATFTRNSVAYKQDGTQVAAGVPRFEVVDGRQGLLVEEGTTNLYDQFNLSKLYGYPSNTFATQQADGFWKIPFGSDIEWTCDSNINIENGQTYTESFYFYCDGTPGTFEITFFTANGHHSIPATIVPVGYSPVVGKYLYRAYATYTTVAGDDFIRVIDIQGKSGGTWTYIAIGWVSLEEKSFVTSYPGDGITRDKEFLNIPTVNIIDKNKGSIEIRFIPLTIQNWNTFFEMPLNIGRFLLFFYSDGTVLWDYGEPNDSIISSPNTAVANQPINICMSWDNTTGIRELMINGQFIGAKAFTPPISLPDLVSIVNNYGALVDDLRISNRARTLEEHQSAYASGQPLPVDDATTYKLNFDGHLQPTVRNFGLFTKNGRMILQDPQPGQGMEVWDGGTRKVLIGRLDDGTIGQEIRGGKIYSTEIRSGEPGASNYVELDAGDSPVRVVRDNKTALELWTAMDYGLMGGSGGAAVFYDVTANDQRGYITAFHNEFGYPYGDGLLVNAEDINRNGKDLLLFGGTARIGANNVVISRADHGPTTCSVVGNFTVYGDFAVTGSGKGCIVDTPSYGMRWHYAVEGPEIRLEEKGCGELVNGQCRIDINPQFLESIEQNLPEAPWVIDVTPYFKGKLAVTEIGDTYFVVSDCDDMPSNGRFAWSLSGVKIGCIGVYMPEFEYEAEGDVLTSNWEDELVADEPIIIDTDVLESDWEDELL